MSSSRSSGADGALRVKDRGVTTLRHDLSLVRAREGGNDNGNVVEPAGSHGVTTREGGTTRGVGEVTEPQHGDLRRRDRMGIAGASLEMGVQ